MKSYTLFIIIAMALSLTSTAQDLQPIRFLMQPGFGFTFPIQKIQTGAITDNLIGNKSTPSYYLQLSANYFGNNFGFGGTVIFNQSTNPQNFVDGARKYYADKYYTEIYDYDNKSILNTTKILVGPSYKIEKGKLVFIYKFQLGISQFSKGRNSAYLKEKNTNTIIEMNWTTDEKTDFFCLNPSLSLGYRLKERLLLNVDLNFNHIYSKFTYTEVAKNIDTKLETSNSYVYNKPIHELSVGVSVAFIMTTYRKTN